MKNFLSRTLSHPVSLVGVAIALIGFVASSVMLGLDLSQEQVDPYRGIFTFLLFPAVIFLGIALCMVGSVLEGRRQKRMAARHEAWRPVLDMGRATHRRIIMTLVGVVALFMIASILGGFRAYEFTEANEFCGQTCHEPMSPQATAHRDSPHAEVPCVECHVGPGIESYIEAKLSGLRQVYKVFTDTIDRPIVAGREKIAHAAKACQHCHWDQRDVGVKLDHRVRFGFDLTSTQRNLRVLMKVGGGKRESGQGIHWHMNIAGEVHYRALDEQHQQIPWVEVRKGGSSVVYRDIEHPLNARDLEDLEVFRFGCLDCHNRPAHQFLTAERAVDKSLEKGRIDRTLPFVKKVSVAALSRSHRSAEAGLLGIREEVDRFYSQSFAGVVLERRETLDALVRELEVIYNRNVWPEMKLDGFTHPDNIGHREFPGCFRCHSGRHATEDGKVLDSRCDLCHDFVESKPGSATLGEIPADGRTYHPWRSTDEHPNECWRCHSGSASPYADCKSCHELEAHGGEYGMGFECSMCHKLGAPEVTIRTCGPCHPAGDSPMHQLADHGDCLSCHKPHSWKADPSEAACRVCHDKLEKDHYPEQTCEECHRFGGMKTTMHGLPVGPAPGN